jgi:hypothetical protein
MQIKTVRNDFLFCFEWRASAEFSKLEEHYEKNPRCIPADGWRAGLCGLGLRRPARTFHGGQLLVLPWPRRQEPRRGSRPATVMKKHANGYTDAEYEAMAKYFAAIK